LKDLLATVAFDGTAQVWDTRTNAMLEQIRPIAERHQGSVRCESRPGGGARFVVELPL
jgi:light-regulated signal transduction histidine kinase (bacteriophytochrome)